MTTPFRDQDLSKHAGYGRLKDRVALVYGAGSIGPGWGNGKASAVAYAREGAAVVCVDRNLVAAQETMDIIKTEGNVAVAFECDVVDEKAIVSSVEFVSGKFGRIDILHNNVGIAAVGGLLNESAETFSNVMDVNLRSAFLTMKHVIPIMVKQGRGVITNISSFAAVQRTPVHFPSYYASKAGLSHLSRTMALEYAPTGIRINALHPGVIDTPMVRGGALGKEYGAADLDAMLESRAKLVPMGFSGTAWDVAWSAVFLASDEARYISGITLPVDGALTAA